MKDLFSQQAAAYSAYRPTYPQELYDYIFSFVEEKQTAWDCATGNGQAAVALSGTFQKVMATDISAAQLANATQKGNIEYLQCSADKTPFADDTFDLVTVAQAYHWLPWDAFNTEVKRVAKNNAVIAIWMYDRFSTLYPELNQLMDDFYFTIVGPYWDAERRFIDDHYTTLPFPYQRLPVQPFAIHTTWTKEQLAGYLSSWSSVQNYLQAKGTSPLELLKTPLDAFFQKVPQVAIQFPLYLHLGRIIK